MLQNIQGAHYKTKLIGSRPSDFKTQRAPTNGSVTTRLIAVIIKSQVGKGAGSAMNTSSISHTESFKN